MAPDAHVAEDGLISHQWKGKPLFLWRLNASVQRNVRALREEWVGRWSTLIEARWRGMG